MIDNVENLNRCLEGQLGDLNIGSQMHAYVVSCLLKTHNIAHVTHCGYVNLHQTNQKYSLHFWNTLGSDKSKWVIDFHLPEQCIFVDIKEEPRGVFNKELTPEYEYVTTDVIDEPINHEILEALTDEDFINYWIPENLCQAINYKADLVENFIWY